MRTSFEKKESLPTMATTKSREKRKETKKLEKQKMIYFCQTAMTMAVAVAAAGFNDEKSKSAERININK